MMQWAGIRLQHWGVRQVLMEIRMKHWKSIQKEVIAAIWGAMIYHTRRGRNWKLFKGETTGIFFAIMKVVPHFSSLLQRLRLRVQERQPHFLNQIAETEDARIVREFAELVDASEAYLALNGEESSEAQSQEKHVAATISERFMGMKAAVITENLRLKSFCNKLGFTVLELNEVISNINNQVDSSALASELFKLLGFQEGKTLESSQFDLVILHVGAGQTTNCLKDLDLVNRLVGNLVQMAHPGMEVGSRLHMSVLLSYGAVHESDDSTFSIADSRQENNSKLSLIFPRQSYTIKEGKPRPNVRQHCSILVAQWQNAVIRKDMAEAYSYEDFKEHSANLVIPTDRFLHEVAFKLWKAPKYGA